MLAFSASSYAALNDEATLDGVKYRVISDSTAEAHIAKSQISVTIAPYVKINEQSYKVVRLASNLLKVDKSKKIISVSLPNTLTEIKGSALWMTNITSLTIPNSVNKIGESAFWGCEQLKNIELPSSIETIPKETFYRCKQLKTVTIPSSVTSIGEKAFQESGIETLNIPNSVKSIGISAFEDCKFLEELTIPNSVQELGVSFITGCQRLEKLTLPDKKPNILAPMSNPFLAIGGTSLREIRENTSEKCPHWAAQLIVKYGESTSPYAERNIRYITNSFSYFANDKIYADINKWQQKKEYESTAQWRARVTEETRKAKVQASLESLKKEYIKERTSKGINALIGTYDADYSTFPVYMAGLDTVYVKVPQEQAPSFKEHWTEVRLYPKYGVVNDQLALLSCSFKLNDNTYQTLKSYTADNSNDKANELIANLSPLDIDFGAGHDKKPVNKDEGSLAATAPTIKIDNALDKNIPMNPTTNKNTFVVVIGNEDYQRVSKVSYALNDASTFASYCQKTLGIPQQNIRSYCNATYGMMLSALDDIKGIANAYHGNLDIIFYYAGHGIPSETDKSAYLLPVDADGVRTEVCLSTKRLYQTLGELNAKNVVVFMDACFSGAQRGEGMLASARGVALKVKADMPQGNTIVFSAATGEETAFPYKEKGHGMFTYFLLKKLQESKGEATLGELGDYVSDEVAKQSIVINHKSQTPTVISSDRMQNWKEIKLKK